MRARSYNFVVTGKLGGFKLNGGIQRKNRSEERIAILEGPRGGLLMESWSLVAVVLIDLMICGALSVQLRDAQVK